MNARISHAYKLLILDSHFHEFGSLLPLWTLACILILNLSFGSSVHISRQCIISYITFLSVASLKWVVLSLAASAMGRNEIRKVAGKWHGLMEWKRTSNRIAISWDWLTSCSPESNIKMLTCFWCNYSPRWAMVTMQVEKRKPTTTKTTVEWMRKKKAFSWKVPLSKEVNI